MPTYVYKCNKCENTVERLLKISEIDRTIVFCDSGTCEDVVMERQIQLTSFALIGSGWAKDGYK